MSPVKSLLHCLSCLDAGFYRGGQLLATSWCTDSGNHWQYAVSRTGGGEKDGVQLDDKTTNQIRSKLRSLMLTFLFSLPDRVEYLSAVNFLWHQWSQESLCPGLQPKNIKDMTVREKNSLRCAGLWSKWSRKCNKKGIKVCVRAQLTLPMFSSWWRGLRAGDCCVSLEQDKPVNHTKYTLQWVR